MLFRSPRLSPISTVSPMRKGRSKMRMTPDTKLLTMFCKPRPTPTPRAPSCCFSDNVFPQLVISALSGDAAKFLSNSEKWLYFTANFYSCKKTIVNGNFGNFSQKELRRKCAEKQGKRSLNLPRMDFSLPAKISCPGGRKLAGTPGMVHLYRASRSLIEEPPIMHATRRCTGLRSIDRRPMLGRS